MKTLYSSGRAIIAVCTLALMLGGCSSYTLNWPLVESFHSSATAKASPPEVQNCLNVNAGTGAITTPEYVCNGKIYSSHELHKMREQSANGSWSSPS